MKNRSVPPSVRLERLFNVDPTAFCAISVGAGGLTLGQAAIVQIDLGRVHSTANPGVLDKDLTGDGIEDISSWARGSLSGRFLTFLSSNYFSYNLFYVEGLHNRARAGFEKRTTGSGSTTYTRYFANVVDSNNSVLVVESGTTPQSATGFVEIRFSDARINDGVETCGLLHLRVSNLTRTEHEVELVRLVFDDSSSNCPDAADLETGYPEFAPFLDVSEDQRAVQLRKELKQLERELRRTLVKARRSKNVVSRKPVSLSGRQKSLDSRLKRKIRKLQRKIRRKQNQLSAVLA